MAGKAGRSDPSLGEALAQEPYRFDFFQAVRLLKLFRLQSSGQVKPAVPVGNNNGSGPPSFGGDRNDVPALKVKACQLPLQNGRGWDHRNQEQAIPPAGQCDLVQEQTGKQVKQ